MKLRQLLVAAIVAVAAGGCSSAAKSDISPTGVSSNGRDLRLVITLLGQTMDTSAVVEGAPCWAYTYYKVTATNQNQKVLGQTQLDANINRTGGTWGTSEGGCVYTVDFGQVPKESQYGININDSAPVYFSYDQAVRNSFILGLSYG